MSAAAGAKRKRVGDTKFYAVRVGQRPGIYHSYEDCLSQVRGVKGALFKSFTSLTDAESFVANGNVGRGPQKYYAVRSGKTPGVYMDWESARQQVEGWKQPKHKSFTTRAEAEAYVQGTDVEASKPKARKTKKQKELEELQMQVAEDSSGFEPGEGPLPLDAEDDFDHRIKLNPQSGQLEYKEESERKKLKMQPAGHRKDHILNIYTDGSALGNGKDQSTAGVGVYFGPLDSRNLSEGLSGSRQTNQRAELTAILRAVEIAPKDQDIRIYSDSQYGINCVTNWFRNWRKNGWKTAGKKTVENKDLIENILRKIEEREENKSRTLFEWLKGHANDPGNTAADKLAVDGAKGAKVASR